MSDVDLLRQKAEALRSELKEIEAAIAVFEKHAGKSAGGFSRLISPLESGKTTAPISDTFSYRTALDWLNEQGALINCRTAIISLLRLRPNGMSKQELREGLEKMGVNVEDSTVTWTLKHYEDMFDNFDRGMYKLRPGNHL